MCNLPSFSIGGSIHIITNNQLGFTTKNTDGRSFDHSSDIVKSFGIPVIRINAADPETTVDSLLNVTKFMIQYKKTYNKDILIDMIGYRKHGHNEVDEPSFTQPEMYEKIRSLTSMPDRYGEKLVSEGVITQQGVEKIIEEIN